MTTTQTREFTGKHMLVSIVAFFGVVIGVNVAMAVSASRTWTGLVVDNSYVASQEFQVKADMAHKQNAAGWTMKIAYVAGSVVAQIAANGQELGLYNVVAFVHRPVGGRDDVTVPLSRGSQGYEGAVALASGVWDVTVTTGPTELGAIERETRISVP